MLLRENPMKLQFRGWKREVTDHDHDVTPVTCSDKSFHPGEVDDPLTWNSALEAFGKVENLALNGSFLVRFTFEQAELQNWLRKFVQAKPEAAVRLLAEMQAEMQGEAILALAKQTEARASERGTLAGDGAANSAAVTDRPRN
jgi:hypothetical protein